MLSGVFIRWLAAPAMLVMAGCGQVQSLQNEFGARGQLLRSGIPSQFNVDAVRADQQRRASMLYPFAFQAGVLREPNGSVVTYTTDLAQQQAALSAVFGTQWQEVAWAGEVFIDALCRHYVNALYELDRDRRTTLTGLNIVQSATVTVLGLTLASPLATGLVGAGFALASGLFDTAVSSMLYRLPPASVVSIIEVQRQALRAQEAPGNPSWDRIVNASAASERLDVYIQHCSPVIIEANIARVLDRTTLDAAGNLVSQTTPAIAGTITAPLIRRGLHPPALSADIRSLTPDQAMIVLREMQPRLATRPEALRSVLTAIAPFPPTSGVQARQYLERWVAYEDSQPGFAEQWTRAIAQARAGGPGVLAPSRPAGEANVAPPTAVELNRQVIRLSQAEQLELARLMFPLLAQRPPATRTAAQNVAATIDALTETNASVFLMAWLARDTAAADREQWAAALRGVRPASAELPTLRARIARLSAAESLLVATRMLPHLDSRSPEVRAAVARIGTDPAALSGAQARQLVRDWAGLDPATPTFVAQWTTALAGI